MSYYNYKNDDDPFEDFHSYGRPSKSTLIAVLSVAITVFVLGCLIRTYRQLESERLESNRQIQELREIIVALQASTNEPVTIKSSDPSPSQPLPSLSSEKVPASSPMDLTILDSTETGSIPPDKKEGQPTYPIVTSTSGMSSLLVKSNAPSEDLDDFKRLTAISADMDLKHVTIEGGRNQSFAPKDSIELYRHGKFVAKLLVLEVFDTISVCEITHSSSMVEVGDQVRVPYRF